MLLEARRRWSHRNRPTARIHCWPCWLWSASKIDPQTFDIEYLSWLYTKLFIKPAKVRVQTFCKILQAYCLGPGPGRNACETAVLRHCTIQRPQFTIRASTWCRLVCAEIKWLRQRCSWIKVVGKPYAVWLSLCHQVLPSPWSVLLWD